MYYWQNSGFKTSTKVLPILLQKSHKISVDSPFESCYNKHIDSNKQEFKMSAKLLKRFQSQAESAQARLDKFAVDFAKDPAHALSWGTDAFARAAELRVLQQIIAALENDTATLENIRSTLMDRVLHKSKYPAQSSSPTSNLIEQYELAACAEVLSNLQYITE
jgi:hypothetical protein